MSQDSAIQWTQATWNPLVGCSRVSAGCANCYAVRDVWRMGANPAAGVRTANQGLVVLNNNDMLDWSGEVRFVASRLSQPLRWRKPRRIFVNSLSDVFHEEVDFSTIRQIFDVMRQARKHTFQVLTKRSERLRELRSQIDWPDNVWMGVSVENAKALSRVDDLRRTAARIKWLSIEPLLEDLGRIDLRGIDWVVVGGESGAKRKGKSGPGARRMDLAWVRDIIEQCRQSEVPIFVKQLGLHWALDNRARDKHGGDMTEWPADLRVHEWPANPVGSLHTTPASSRKASDLKGNALVVAA